MVVAIVGISTDCRVYTHCPQSVEEYGRDSFSVGSGGCSSGEVDDIGIATCSVPTRVDVEGDCEFLPHHREDEEAVTLDDGQLAQESPGGGPWGAKYRLDTVRYRFVYQLQLY